MEVSRVRNFPGNNGDTGRGGIGARITKPKGVASNSRNIVKREAQAHVQVTRGEPKDPESGLEVYDDL